MALGMLHDHRRRPGVLARVVVVKAEVQHAFEVGQPVPAVPSQLRPCPPCNRDAVAPQQVGDVDAVAPAGGIHRLPVKVAVLDKPVLRQQGQKDRQGIVEPGRLRHVVRTDAVQPDVERCEPGAGIDQHRECHDLVVGLHAGKTDLADAGRVVAGRLHIQRDEAEASLRDLFGMVEMRSVRGVVGPGGWERGTIRRLLTARSTILAAFRKPISKCHSHPLFSLSSTVPEARSKVRPLPARRNLHCAEQCGCRWSEPRKVVQTCGLPTAFDCPAKWAQPRVPTIQSDADLASRVRTASTSSSRLVQLPSASIPLIRIRNSPSTARNATRAACADGVSPASRAKIP